MVDLRGLAFGIRVALVLVFKTPKRKNFNKLKLWEYVNQTNGLWSLADSVKPNLLILECIAGSKFLFKVGRALNLHPNSSRAWLQSIEY